MNPLSSAVLTGGIVTVANLVNKKELSFRQLVGVGIYAILLAGVNEVDEALARKFALLVLIGVMLRYTPTVVKGIGLAK